MRNKVGESTEPCLTPREMLKQLDTQPFTFTLADDVEYQCFSSRQFPIDADRVELFEQYRYLNEVKGFFNAQRGLQ